MGNQIKNQYNFQEGFLSIMCDIVKFGIFNQIEGYVMHIKTQT